MLTSLFTREMQIKVTVRHDFTATGMARLKSQIITSVVEKAEKSKPSYIAGGNVKW